MEFFDVLRTALGEFWKALKTDTDHISDISMLVVTTLAAIFTARAAIATRNSTKVAEATLLHTQKTSRRDEFISRYTLLLEQHKEQLSIVKSYLNEDSGKKQLKELTMETDHLKAFKTLQGHNIISPYMRVLYHLLRHISVYYVENANIEEKKLYSSTVRSLIRNDVLFLVAVNASYVIEDNEENDYGKYQRLLREFDFFEHALFFSACEVAPGLEKDAVSKAGDKVIKAVLNNHKRKLEYDKSHYFYKYEEFSLPFIVSCIFENPLHEESVACLETIETRIKEKAHTACKEYVINYKSQGEQEFSLLDYYGRKYFSKTDSLLDEIKNNWRIDPDVYQQLPEVDDRYIDNCLTELKADHPEKLPENCYIRNFNKNNNVNLKYHAEFIKSCLLLLSWQKHLHRIDSRESDREFIRHEEQRWSDFRNAVLKQRLKG